MFLKLKSGLWFKRFIHGFGMMVFEFLRDSLNVLTSRRALCDDGDDYRDHTWYVICRSEAPMNSNN